MASSSVRTIVARPTGGVRERVYQALLGTSQARVARKVGAINHRIFVDVCLLYTKLQYKSKSSIYPREEIVFTDPKQSIVTSPNLPKGYSYSISNQTPSTRYIISKIIKI